MTQEETLAKIAHYEMMSSEMKLNPAHRAWIGDRLDDLYASLGKVRS
jgi:hypothetical protein